MEYHYLHFIVVRALLRWTRVTLLSRFQHLLVSKWGIKKNQFAFLFVSVVSADFICSFAVQRFEWGESCCEVP